MRYNPNEYEPVEERVKKFYADHPTGSILTKLESSPDNMDFSVFSAEIIVDGATRARGWAQEIRDKELAKNRQGQEYESVNYTSWLENAETSAIGRALANFNYAGSKRPSREEMQKAERRTIVAEPPQKSSAEAKVVKADADYWRDLLLSYLLKVENVVGKANADKLREAANKHNGDAEWYKKALAKTEDEAKRQEAVLAANTNPAADAIKKLQQAAEDSGRVAPATTTQQEIF
jgi:hypothetical protein